MKVSDYLERIHFPAPMDLDSLKPSASTLQTLHEAHLLSVPFENLSIHNGEPIILQEQSLYDKIVRRQRGGFCYELNGLFAWLLRQIGFQVTLLSAETTNGDGSFSPDFDHLTLLAHQLAGADWLADVGFGDSFRQPMRLEPGREGSEMDGRKYRLQRDSSESQGNRPRDYWTVQQFDKGKWHSQYRFTLEPRALSDFEPMCHYNQTSPESYFTQKRICTLATLAGRITLSDLRLITTRHGQRDERTLESEEEYREILAEQFGIVL